MYIGLNLIFIFESCKFEEKRLIYILKIGIDIFWIMLINKRSKYIDFKYIMFYSFILFMNYWRWGFLDWGVSEVWFLVREWYYLFDMRNMLIDSWV